MPRLFLIIERKDKVSVVQRLIVTFQEDISAYWKITLDTQPHSDHNKTHTHTHTHNRLTAVDPVPEETHPLTPILIIGHPLSTFSINYDP